MPRDRRNMINDGTTGLLASPPLGFIGQQQQSQGPIKGGILEAVSQRGVLHCGIRGDRPGFARYHEELSRWEGMDVEFCRLLAAALFDGDSTSVVFEDVSGREGFELLHQGNLDVLAGAIWTIQEDMKGSSFTQPYFYGPVGNSRLVAVRG